MIKAKKTKARAAGSLDVALGQKIRSRRIMAHLSQMELGEALGVSFQQVQKYEKGVNRVSTIRIQQIADALQEDVAYFMNSDVCGVSAEAIDMSAAMTERDVIRLVKAFRKLPASTRQKMMLLMENVAPTKVKA